MNHVIIDLLFLEVVTVTYYINLETGEYTENQREAVNWYTSGCDVFVSNDRVSLTWEH